MSAFVAGDKVDRPGWGDTEVYTVVSSGFYRTNVVTDDGVDISFATADLRKILNPHNEVRAGVIGNTVRVYMSNKFGAELSTGITPAQARELIYQLSAALNVLED